MSGITATVLLRQPFAAVDTGRVTELLRNVVDDASETRKGRHWDFTVQAGAGSLSVVSTSQHGFDFEDQLMANELLFEDAPDAFVLWLACRSEGDRNACTVICERLAKSFGGIDCGLVG